MKKLTISLTLCAVVMSSAALLTGCLSGGGGGDAIAATTVTPAMNKFFPVLREAAPGLDGYTVYRPADLSVVGGSIPVLLWANGACKSSNHRYWDTLGAIAARGFVVVAYGASNQVVINESQNVTPSRMAKSLDWVKSTITSKPGYELVDVNKIGVFGTSCGGLEALVAGGDARVKSVAGLNTGFFDAGSTSAIRQGFSISEIAKLHTPTIFIGGGTSDVAYNQTHSNYAASTVPTVLAENPAANHNGFWVGLRYTLSATDPTVSTVTDIDYTITTEFLEAVIRWFDWTLNDVKTQSAHFLGSDCGLCKVTGWTVQSKNFQ